MIGYKKIAVILAVFSAMGMAVQGQGMALLSQSLFC